MVKKNPNFNTSFYPLSCNLKTKPKFGDEFKSKVVDLVMVCNFRVLSF